MNRIEKLVAELENRELKPRIWEKAGFLRVYIKPGLGRKMARDGKVFFDYAEQEDKEMAREIADGSLPLTHGAILRVWHPNREARTWAFEQMRETAFELNGVMA